MQHDYWDNTRACSRRRRRFGRRRTCLKKGGRNAKKEAKEDHQDVLVASVGRRGVGEDRANPHENQCVDPLRSPSLVRPPRPSQFVRVWPLYPDCCFRLPFYQNGSSSSLESACTTYDMHADTQIPLTLPKLYYFPQLNSSSPSIHRRKREEITAAISTVAVM